MDTESSSIIELPDDVAVALKRRPKSPRRRLFETILRWVMRVILAAVFLYAGILKVKDPIQFAEDIRNYQIVSDPIPAAVALTLPWLEILAALGVLTGLLYRGSLLALGGMILFFMAAISSAWARGLDISCGCFGERSAGETNYPLHLFENAVLLGLCAVLWLYCWRQTRRSASTGTASASPPGGQTPEAGETPAQA